MQSLFTASLKSPVSQEVATRKLSPSEEESIVKDMAWRRKWHSTFVHSATGLKMSISYSASTQGYGLAVTVRAASTVWWMGDARKQGDAAKSKSLIGCGLQGKKKRWNSVKVSGS
jgi:hypothetical protein